MSSTASGIKIGFQKINQTALKFNFGRQADYYCPKVMLFHFMGLPLYCALVHPLLLETVGDGPATLLLVGVQHEVALGGIEYVISGMSGSVVKNGGALYAATITYVNEISRLRWLLSG